MNASTDVEEAFDSIQHPFMIKTLNNLGIEGIYLNIIEIGIRNSKKYLYSHVYCNTVYNSQYIETT